MKWSGSKLFIYRHLFKPVSGENKIKYFQAPKLINKINNNNNKIKVYG